MWADLLRRLGWYGWYPKFLRKSICPQCLIILSKYIIFFHDKHNKE